jgi:hypothetical protein
MPKAKNENIFIEFKGTDVLKKNFVLSINTGIDISEKVAYSQNQFSFNDAIFRKKGLYWLYIKNDKVLFKTNLEMKEIRDVSGKVLYKSKGLAKNKRQWIDSNTRTIRSTSSLRNEKKGIKVASLDTAEMNDLSRIMLLERMMYSKNVELSNASVVF